MVHSPPGPPVLVALKVTSININFAKIVRYYLITIGLVEPNTCVTC